MFGAVARYGEASIQVSGAFCAVLTWTDVAMAALRVLGVLASWRAGVAMVEQGSGWLRAAASCLHARHLLDPAGSRGWADFELLTGWEWTIMFPSLAPAPDPY